ncbi:MAG: hypothetical protein ABSH01_11260 [Terriglobia bacterium]|jgi:hypothetical protein
MGDDFYAKAGSLISPGDIFDGLPYIRVPSPLKVSRKVSFSLPPKYKLEGELHEVFEVGRHNPTPGFNLDPKGQGEDVLSTARMSKAIFLTWGSEVEGDERSGRLYKKDWLIAPVFPLAGLEGLRIRDRRTGDVIEVAEATRAGKSPKYFPLQPFPREEIAGYYYVDFRKLCPLAASYFSGLPRRWRLSPAALNDFYNQLMWFFTRQRVFFEPVKCRNCGTAVDLRVIFEGQPVDGGEGT